MGDKKLPDTESDIMPEDEAVDETAVEDSVEEIAIEPVEESAVVPGSVKEAWHEFAAEVKTAGIEPLRGVARRWFALVGEVLDGLAGEDQNRKKKK